MERDKQEKKKNRMPQKKTFKYIVKGPFVFCFWSSSISCLLIFYILYELLLFYLTMRFIQLCVASPGQHSKKRYKQE